MIPVPRMWMRWAVVFSLLAVPLSLAAQSQALTDQVTFGDPASETAHHFSGTYQKLVNGPFHQTARALLPQPAAWRGGTLSFSLAVDPNKPNYVTIRYWGSEFSADRLVLFVDGKALGYEHLGDYDMLDFGSLSAPCPGRFVYSTTVLPSSLTRGKAAISLEIRGTGPINRFGADFEHFQLPMKGNTRAIYNAYSHTGPYLTPPAQEPRGATPANPPTRMTPGPEVIDHVKSRVNAELGQLLKQARPLNQLDLWFLSRAYYVPWTEAYKNPAVLLLVARSMDTLYAKFKADPAFVHNDPGVYNSGWTGVGFAGEAVAFLSEPLKPFLDQPLSGDLTHRAAWSEMLKAGRDYLLTHRPSYTNQTMITDLSMYRTNRGLAAIDPANALPEQRAIHFLYQAIGIEPWLGSDTPSGPSRPLGDHYFELTQKGLTRELGFVGYYGEVLDWVSQIYSVTQDPAHPERPGDARIRAQLVKMELARSNFRYPQVDADGNRAMVMETIVGWRDDHYPAEVTYAERSASEGSALSATAITLDPRELGFVRQMIADNQLYASIEDLVGQRGTRVSKTLLLVPDELDAVRAASPGSARLPMSLGSPDFIFSDEEDGVVAILHGSEKLYASLYWRSGGAVNHLARVHDIQPDMDHLATVLEDAEFVDSGKAVERRDNFAFGFGNGGPRYPDDFHSALTGLRQPVAAAESTGGGSTESGKNPSPGRASFYTLRYGRYVIAMNTTSDKSYALKVPKDPRTIMDLRSGKNVQPGSSLSVPPQTTTVLWVQAER